MWFSTGGGSIEQLRCAVSQNPKHHLLSNQDHPPGGIVPNGAVCVESELPELLLCPLQVLAILRHPRMVPPPTTATSFPPVPWQVRHSPLPLKMPTRFGKGCFGLLPSSRRHGNRLARHIRFETPGASPSLAGNPSVNRGSYLSPNARRRRPRTSALAPGKAHFSIYTAC